MPPEKFALNLPIIDLLADCKNVLIAGMGGGFDIFCGLPIYLALKAHGIQVHLANLSFSEVEYGKHAVRLTKSLVGVQAQQRSILPYFPELYLARWFQEKRQEEVTVWCFAKTGAQQLTADYRLLIEHLHIDGILLIDGGVDSLMRGNEAQTGTPVEDTLSLLAVQAQEQVPVRLLACLGLGAETDISHAQVFESIAALSASESFLGSCALIKQMEVYRAYEEAVLYAHEHSPTDPSVINASILSAVQGQYGNFHLTSKTKGSRLWISPLMPLYWFFALEAVAARNLLIDYLAETETFPEAVRAVLAARQALRIRPHTSIPLP